MSAYDLLTSNAKLVKEGEHPAIVRGLSLAPADISGRNVCKHSTLECRPPACVAYAGRGNISSVIAARIRRTNMFFDNREEFARRIDREMVAHIRECDRADVLAAVRLNVFSDIPWERVKLPFPDGEQTIIDRFYMDVQFYDYTKFPWGERKSSYRYHLTYSYTGYNYDSIIAALDDGGNVAVVFDTPRGDNLPREWEGYPVIDGDADDHRWTDPDGAVVGLRAKGARRLIVGTPFVWTVTA